MDFNSWKNIINNMFYIILFSSFDNLFVTFSSTKARRILLFVTLIDLTHIFCYKSVPSYLRLKKQFKKSYFSWIL